MKSVIKVLLLAGLWAAGSALAGARLVEVEVYDRAQARVLRTYQHQGMKYVEGKPGNEYQIVLRNRTGQRVLAVVSVDGVNAVTGQTAAASQSGYVLGAWGRAEIAGWRKDMNDVAAFYFTALPDAYAARTGRPDNVGVIGVAVYAEYLEPPRALLEAPAAAKPEAAARSGDDAANRQSAGAPAAPSAQDSQESAAPRRKMAEEKLGTGHGERLHAPTQHTAFQRASSTPNQVIAIYYDSRRNLIAQGVIPRYARLPQAFPGDGFVPDPS